ncbi:hypothetical protein GCM10028803_53030 [Larkinella knui]|uniref:Uncharacterized protein n=1 Tax=Larkinella knui TaxID=2025310 RepID=A0A3P1CGM0_9BACT|nr:hypothetical protein [Larkinella knui]RRB12491.1 hypothetical protein EHT87_20035 [Larkinella knui]
MNIKESYEYLRVVDERRYNEFRAKLALEGCLTTFERTVCKPDYNLKRVDFWIAECMIEYLEFDYENFRSNTMPETAHLFGIQNKLE